MFWKRRQGTAKTVINGVDGVSVTGVLGRMVTVDPRQTDRYAIRLLLTHQVGPASFENLRTVNDVIMNTYVDACVELGLTKDDKHWDDTLDDGALLGSVYMLRRMFAVILTQNVSTKALLYNMPVGLT